MWFRRRRAEERLDTELRYHYERMVRESIAAGVDPAEARRRTRLEFGGVEQIKDDCRDVRGRWLEDFAKDVRYAGRTLRRSPGFVAVSVLSLALGIGANTAIFSLINALMLRPLPVSDPQRLVYITRTSAEGRPLSVSYPLFEYFRDNVKSVSNAAIEMQSSPAILVDNAEEIVDAELVSGAHFSVLQMAPAAGRLLEPADDVLSPVAPAAVISYGYWKRRFVSNPAVVGKTFTLQIRKRIFTIVGVTPPQYHGARMGRDPDLTLPITMLLSDEIRHEPTANQFDMLGRLAPGATLEQANAEIQVLWRAFQNGIAATLPEKNRAAILEQRAAAFSGVRGLDRLRSTYSQALFVLMGMVMLVMLLACANLSGLLLARAAARQREISIRLAMGAGGGRLVRQFLTESVVLAALGGVAGLLFSGWFSRSLVAMMAAGDGLLLSTAPDWRVLAFTAGASLAACVLSGLAPGLHAVRVNLNPGLKQARSGSRQRLGKTLLVAQLAISMVLVTGATLFAGTIAKLYGVDRGMRTDGVLAFRVRTSEQYSRERSWSSLNAVLERLNAIAGVSSASVVDVLPISGSLWDRNVQVEGYTFRRDESEIAGFNAIGPKYFETVRTPMVEGREFGDQDTTNAPKVAIVNEAFARYFFGGRVAVGRRVTSRDATYEIVGVAKDAKYSDLRQEMLRTVYIPCAQRGEQPSNYWFLARARAGDPIRLVPAIEQAVRAADAGLRLRTARPYSAIVDQTMTTERIMAALGGFFGLLALIVACLGIFGAMAFQVSRRANEIGLRMALGASRGGIVRLVLREVAGVVAVGCLAGATTAIPLAGLTRKMLFGVTPTDPRAFVTAAAVMGLAAFTAGWLPARRASRADPMVALRHE